MATIDSRGAADRPPNSPSDEQLVQAVVGGVSDAYEALVRRHQERLYRYGLGMVMDPDVAADLVQDAFVQAYTKLDRCRDPGRFGTWVFQILRNRCLDHLKSRRRRDVSLDAHPEPPANGAGPESDLERRDLAEVLDRALAQLPDAQREAFVLKHVQDLTYEEMADAVGASVSALRMRVLRAREVLRSLLRDQVGAADEAL